MIDAKVFLIHLLPFFCSITHINHHLIVHINNFNLDSFNIYHLIE